MSVTTNYIVTGNGITGSTANAVQSLVTGAVNPSPYCKLFVPMLQQVSSGPAKDYSGNANDIALGSGVSTAGVWADTSRELNSWMVLEADGAANTKHMYVPNLTAPWDLSEWMIFSMTIKPSIASTARPIVRCGATGVSAGWSLQDNGSGKMRFLIYNAAGASAVGDVTSAATLFASGAARLLTVAIDPVTGNIHLFVNGHSSETFPSAYSGSGTASRLLTFGSVPAASNTTSMASGTYGALFGPVHYYTGSGALPSNHVALARRLADMPTVPLSEFELPA